MNFIVITIDGGAGTGTTTLAKHLARHLGWEYLNTGHLYRSVAWWVRQHGINPHDEQAVSAIAEAIEFEFRDGSVIKVNSLDVTDDILAGMSDLVPHIAHYRDVRKFIRVWQQRFAEGRHCVIEGRDLGSVVFSDSPFKIFLTCDDRERAKRRSNQAGRVVTVDELRERDRLDAEREESPMIKPDGAYLLNTTETSIPELVSAVEVFMRGVPEIRAVICS